MRAAATPAAGTPHTASSPACRRRAVCRTRAAWCAPRTPGETDRSRGSSSRGLPAAPQLAQQIADLGGLERFAAIAGVVEEPAPGLRAELVARDLLLDQARRPEAIVAERFGQKAARAVEDVDAAPVDELEDADRRVAESHPGLEGAVDVFRRRDAFLDQTHGLVHQQGLHPGPDESRRVGAADRHLAELLEPGDRALDARARGRPPGHDLDQRDDVRRIQPVDDEEALGASD